MTTLKVPVEVRDRFAQAAAVKGTTVRALLDGVSQQMLDEALIALVDRQMRALPPEEWADYMAEGDQWERGTMDPIRD